MTRPAHFHRRQHGRGFALPELLAALLVFGVALLGAASLHSGLLQHQQSLRRDGMALLLARELDERRRIQPQFSCTELAHQPGIFRASSEGASSWDEALRTALPAVQYRLSETARGCRVELDYMRRHGEKRLLLWE